MTIKDFHVHTTFCDGKNTPEEIVKKAITLNVKELGLVCHAYTPCDESYCIKRENVDKFTKEVNALKEKYKEKIKLFVGVEFDYFAYMPLDNFDFAFGSLHYVIKNGKYFPVDESKEKQIQVVSENYGGDFYAFCEDYFAILGDIYSKVKSDFIAHFDLVSKYNKQGELFDENNPRYIKAWTECADKLVKEGAIFELNLGGILRGYKDTPYPSKPQIEYILERGGKFIINTDSHKADTVGKLYEEYHNIIGENNIRDIF